MPKSKSRVSPTHVFGQNVRARRLELELTQEKLAETAGLHRTYVGSLERGERNIALKNILKLARALKVQPTDLLRGIDA